jgi:hypothetical protein
MPIVPTVVGERGSGGLIPTVVGFIGGVEEIILDTILLYPQKRVLVVDSLGRVHEVEGKVREIILTGGTGRII